MLKERRSSKHKPSSHPHSLQTVMRLFPSKFCGFLILVNEIMFIQYLCHVPTILCAGSWQKMFCIEVWKWSWIISSLGPTPDKSQVLVWIRFKRWPKLWAGLLRRKSCMWCLWRVCREVWGCIWEICFIQSCGKGESVIVNGAVFRLLNLCMCVS